MIGVRLYDVNLYEEFIGGQNCKPLLDVLGALGKDYFYDLLHDNERYEKTDERQTQVFIGDKLKELYHAIFVKEYTIEEYRINFGKYVFKKETKETLIRVTGGLSSYMDLS